jgi:hypothetical protein
MLLLAHHPPAYASAEGWTTFLVPVLAGYEDHLRMPSQFMEAMVGQEMAYAILQECSAGKPKYRVKIYYDSKGKCYFRNGWPKFFMEYGVHAGWFLVFTRHNGMQELFVRVFDGTLYARSFAAWS